MRKTLLISIILLLVYFLPSVSYAACLYEPDDTGSCPGIGYEEYCPTNGLCCSTSDPNDCPADPVNQQGGNANLQGSCNADHIETAIGCIPVSSSQEFAGFVLRWSIGIASGIAFLLLVYGAIQIMTSSGDPKRLQAGQELITATISGLLFIIFSVFLLRIIGVDILGIFS